MNDESNARPSPGLNMEHGFVKKIEQNQLVREQQVKEDMIRRQEAVKLARKVGFANKSAKPTMEIYRPPSLRVSGDFSAFQFVKGSELLNQPNGNQRGAFVFVPQTTAGNEALSIPISTSVPSFSGPVPLSKSNSTTHAHRTVQFQLPPNVMTYSSRKSPPTGVPGAMAVSNFGLKRSKSLGATDLKARFHADYDMSGFAPEVQVLIRRAIDDPNRLPTRQLMEAVRHLFARLLEGTRFAEPSARIALAIIEKEKNATFLESLLNTCREWYKERDRLPFRGGTGGAGRWVAYVTFIFELYLRLKSRQQRWSQNQTTNITSSSGNVPPQTTLLTLLSECCLILLKPPSVNSLGEIECLFFVLTSIGRDLQCELPLRMQAVVAALRDAFMAPTVPQAVRKTLLQLIELHASKWQLPATAVMYYYPGSHDRK